jgi:predicted enzyme related to lactoylglutathione lyase
VPVDHEQGLTQRLKKVTINANAIIYIETRSLKSVYENVQRVGALVLGQIDYRHGRRFFRCLDPDGTVIEPTEAVGST